MNVSHVPLRPLPDANLIALRLHLVVPWNDHTAIRDTIFQLEEGPMAALLYFALGTMVVYLSYSMHRRVNISGKTPKNSGQSAGKPYGLASSIFDLMVGPVFVLGSSLHLLKLDTRPSG